MAVVMMHGLGHGSESATELTRARPVYGYGYRNDNKGKADDGGYGYGNDNKGEADDE